MNIKEHIKESMEDGWIPAMIVTRGGIEGVLFTDENEFIAFTDLNYNNEMGYFRMSLLPDEKRDCTNDAPKDKPKEDRRKFNTGAPGRKWAEPDTVRVAAYIPKSWADSLVRLGRNQASAIRAAIQFALNSIGEPHPNGSIELKDALPCGIRANTPTGTCGKPATVAHANRMNHPYLPGHWVLLPVCQECAIAAAKV